MSRLPICVYCGKLVAPSQAHQRIQGWEHRGATDSRRGGSDIILRERLDEYACDLCVSRLRAGVNPDQEKLL